MRVTGNKPLVTYKLSIHIFADGQFVYIHDGGSNKVLWKEKVPVSTDEESALALHQTLQQPRLQNMNFISVDIISHFPTTCIPLEFFRKDDMLKLYRTTFAGTRVSSTDLHYQILTDLEAVCIFTLAPKILQTVQRIHPHVQVQCAEGHLLEEMAFIDRKNTDSEIHFYAVCQEEMVLCAFRQKKLYFTCTYQADNDADRIYYLLAVWKNLDLDVHKNICRLHGASSELTLRVGQYIKHTEICE